MEEEEGQSKNSEFEPPRQLHMRMTLHISEKYQKLMSQPSITFP